MAGGMRRLGVYLGLVEEDPTYDPARDHEEAQPEPRREPVAAGRREPRSDRASRSERSERTETRGSSRTPVRAGGSSSGGMDTIDGNAVRTLHEQPLPRVPVPAVVPSMEAEPMEAHYRITTIHPRAYNDARRIGEEFRDGVPVIMNLTEMDDGDAKRIVDFAAGLVFGLAGSIERVTNKVFLLSPVNVDVAAEARAQLEQDGFYNQS